MKQKKLKTNNSNIYKLLSKNNPSNWIASVGLTGLLEIK